MKTLSKTNRRDGSASASRSTAPGPDPQPQPTASTGSSQPDHISAEQNAETFRIGRSPSEGTQADLSTSPSSNPELLSRPPDYSVELEEIKLYFRAIQKLAENVVSRVERAQDVARSYCKNPRIQAIQEVVGKRYNLPMAVFVSKRRQARLVRARFVAIYLSRKLTDYTVTEVADCFFCHHSNITHAKNSIENLLLTDSGFLALLASIEEEAKTEIAKIDMPLFEVLGGFDNFLPKKKASK